MMCWTLLVLFFAAPADDGLTKPAPKLAGKITKGRETLDIVAEKDGVRLRVKHGGGIGGAEIKLEEGVWPRMRLELDGFQLLEFVDLSTDQIQITTSLRQAPGCEVKVRKPDGGWQGDPKKERWKVPLMQKGNTIVIEVPAEMCKGSKVLRLAWIDAFR